MIKKEYCLTNTLGFTFTEVILVVALLGFLAALGIPFYQSFQISVQLDNTTQELAQTLRRAQALAMASDDFSQWGVHIGNKSFILFKGSTFASNGNFNEPHKVPGTLSLNSGIGQDVVFQVITGNTSNTGQIILRSSNGRQTSISINQLGRINVD